MIEADQARKTELETKLTGETIPKNFKFFEDKLAKTNTGFLIGSSLTWADLYLYHVIDWIGSYKDTALASSPALQSYLAHITAIPNIANWLKTRPTTVL